MFKIIKVKKIFGPMKQVISLIIISTAVVMAAGSGILHPLTPSAVQFPPLAAATVEPGAEPVDPEESKIASGQMSSVATGNDSEKRVTDATERIVFSSGEPFTQLPVNLLPLADLPEQLDVSGQEPRMKISRDGSFDSLEDILKYKTNSPKNNPVASAKAPEDAGFAASGDSSKHSPDSAGSRSPSNHGYVNILPKVVNANDISSTVDISKTPDVSSASTSIPSANTAPKASLNVPGAQGASAQAKHGQAGPIFEFPSEPIPVPDAQQGDYPSPSFLPQNATAGGSQAQQQGQQQPTAPMQQGQPQSVIPTPNPDASVVQPGAVLTPMQPITDAFVDDKSVHPPQSVGPTDKLLSTAAETADAAESEKSFFGSDFVFWSVVVVLGSAIIIIAVAICKSLRII